MTTAIWGEREWSVKRDEDGYREYKLKTLVVSDTPCSPTAVLTTPGLPIFGSIWSYGGDIDIYAWCRWDADVTSVVKSEPGNWFEIEHTFSSKPKKKCKDKQSEDPILEPPEISGSFEDDKEEITHTYYGAAITNSAFEIMRGPHVEFKRARGIIKVKMNLPFLNIQFFNGMINTVNASTFWGAAPRCVLFADFDWTKKFYGECYPYYEVTLTFKIDRNTWDRVVLDEGTKALRGHWEMVGQYEMWVLDKLDGKLPDPSRPSDFIVVTDRNGNRMKVVLDGEGNIWQPHGWTICFNGTHDEARSELDTRGGDLLQGPFASESECTGSTTVNPYLAPGLILIRTADGGLQAVPDFGQGPSGYWSIGKISNDPAQPPLTMSCLFGPRQAAEDEAANAVNQGFVFGYIASGPFTTQTACEEYNTGTSSTPAWWKISSGGSNAGKRVIQAYPPANFYAFGVPLTF